jgi:hypothetical protein
MAAPQLRKKILQAAQPTADMWLIRAYVQGHWLLAFVLD